MRHSISAGGRAFPPPKYCSYSIFSWRMSFSSWARSSSTVLAMGRESGRSGELLLSEGVKARSTFGAKLRAEEIMFPAVVSADFREPMPGVQDLERKVQKCERGSFPSPFSSKTPFTPFQPRPERIHHPGNKSKPLGYLKCNRRATH